MNNDTPEPAFYYFGYGYNLNPDLFKERLKDGKWLPDKLHKTGSFDGPEPIDLGTYILPGYRFTYDLDLQDFHEKGTVANVRPALTNQVYGALYRITAIQLKRLDRSEEVPRIYERKLVKVYKEGKPGSFIEAWIDLGNDKAITQSPHPEDYYEKEIVQAATNRGFPADYIDHYLRFPQPSRK